MVFNFVTSGLEALLLVFKSAGGLIGLVIYDIGQRFSLLGQVVGSFSSQV